MTPTAEKRVRAIASRARRLLTKSERSPDDDPLGEEAISQACDLLTALISAVGIKRRLTPEDRFYSHVAMTTRCWPWIGAADSAGNPVVRWRGKLMLAVRVAWFLERGEWPEGNLRRTCDNSRCIAPKHRRERVLPKEGTLTGPVEISGPWMCARGHTLLEPPKDGRCPKCRLARIRNRRKNRPDRKLAALRELLSAT